MMHINYYKIYSTPENFTHQNVKYFLQNIAAIFCMKNSGVPKVIFKVKDTKKVDILGLLLIYKFIDFTVKNRCFENPKTDLKKNRIIFEQMIQIGFKKYIDENFGDLKDDDLVESNPNFTANKNFFIAPLVLNREQQNLGISNERKIKEYYNFDSRIASGVLQCIGEIASNFQEHSQSDTRSMLVARGDRKYIEIACADNGDGIISTLRPHLENKCKNGYEVLRKSIDENVTSKKNAGHMGCGLWIVSQFVSESKGTMKIFSQDGYLVNDKGKIKCGKSAYWKGTIVYVNMPLSDPSVFSKVMRNKRDEILDSMIMKGNKITLNII